MRQALRRAAILALGLVTAGTLALSALATGGVVRVVVPSGGSIHAECAGDIGATPDADGLTVVCEASATATPTPGGEWWLAGGVDAASVVGAYKGKGASSYADSLVNLNDASTHTLRATGAPTWTVTDGWHGGQSDYFTVDGGAYPNERWSAVLRVSDAATASQQFAGTTNDPAHRDRSGWEINNTGAFQDWFNWGVGYTAPPLTSSVLALAGKDVYIDGVHRTGITTDPPYSSTGQALYDLTIMTSNWGGHTHGGGHRTQYWGFALYSDTLTAGQAAAIATAMADW